MNQQTRRGFLGTMGASAWAVMAGRGELGQESAGEFPFSPDKNIIPAPRDPALWPAFRAQLAKWREQTRRQLGIDDALYRRPEFAWSASNYACLFLMMCDEAFYNHRDGRYTWESLLEEGRQEFGGYDSLVLWHAYPRIGVDQRNQFDFYRDMPGGLSGLRDVVHGCQRQGVRVYIDYNPWDTGTRREGQSDLDTLVEFVRAMDVDGIFLDTMTQGAADFRAKLDGARPGVVLEGEGVPPLERIADHHASWAQHFDDSEVPGVLRHKWLERRHMQHQIRRWKFDHSGELQSAWMNGSGMMVWENVFGSWVAWSARDRSLLRSMLPIQRRYWRLFAGEGWVPLVPAEKSDVYASLWEDGERRLWTLVNRSDRPETGALLKVDASPPQLYFDLIAGRELYPVAEGGRVSLESEIPGRGLACFLAAPAGKLGDDFKTFLAAQAATRRRADYRTDHLQRETRLVPVAPTARRQAAPAGMVVVRPQATERLTIEMRLRECGFYDSRTDDEEGFWSSYRFQTRSFERSVQLRPFAIDETLVTNAQFAQFIKSSNYRPRQPHRFLEHWDGGEPPAALLDHAVVWVDLDDARAYARWAGKRLPTEEEWQLAAQGPERLKYPWGNQMEPGRCNGGETGGTTPVRAFPGGRSPCGCYDMCGNVWQWTESERSDGRTRFSIIRGGSYFAARGSNWYVDGGPRPADFATKFLLMWPGLDRCATIGFRCVADLEETEPDAVRRDEDRNDRNTKDRKKDLRTREPKV